VIKFFWLQLGKPADPEEWQGMGAGVPCMHA